MPKCARVPNVVAHAETGVPSFVVPAPLPELYAVVSCAALPACRLHVAPVAGAVAVLRALLAGVLRPPKKTRRLPSAASTRSGLLTDLKPVTIAFFAPDGVPFGLIPTCHSVGLAPDAGQATCRTPSFVLTRPTCIVLRPVFSVTIVHLPGPPACVPGATSRRENSG